MVLVATHSNAVANCTLDRRFCINFRSYARAVDNVHVTTLASVCVAAQVSLRVEPVAAESVLMVF